MSMGSRSRESKVHLMCHSKVAPTERLMAEARALTCMKRRHSVVRDELWSSFPLVKAVQIPENLSSRALGGQHAQASWETQ
jgi:hypothetical protein